MARIRGEGSKSTPPPSGQSPWGKAWVQCRGQLRLVLIDPTGVFGSDPAARESYRFTDQERFFSSCLWASKHGILRRFKWSAFRRRCQENDRSIGDFSRLQPHKAVGEHAGRGQKTKPRVQASTKRTRGAADRLIHGVSSPEDTEAQRILLHAPGWVRDPSPEVSEQCSFVPGSPRARGIEKSARHPIARIGAGALNQSRPVVSDYAPKFSFSG